MEQTIFIYLLHDTNVVVNANNLFKFGNAICLKVLEFSPTGLR